ncbi:MAG: NUDIX domain-containing protein [Pseudomonadota bacterium]
MLDTNPPLRHIASMKTNTPYGVSTAVHWRGHWLLGLRGNQLWRGLWSLPGGRVENGETPTAAAVRELNEETGLQADAADIQPLLDLNLGEGRTLAVHIWIAPTAVPLQPVAASDCLGTSWLTLEAILAMPESAKTPRLDEVMTAAAQHLPTDS